MFEAKKINYINYLINLCICIPPIIYIKTINKYALNIPREDDYDAMLGFLCKFKNLSFGDRITSLFSQQGEHRILLTKIILLLHYFVYGDINFRHLIFVNLILLIIIFLVLIYFIKKSFPSNWNVAVLLMSLGLFDLNNFENADFASSGLFNYAVIALFLLSLLFYSFKNNIFIIPAVILQAICIYSGGNGMIGALFIVVYIILNRRNLQSIASIVTFLIFTPMYFYHFSNPNSVYFTLDITKSLPYFLTALGANFGIQYGLLAGILIALSLILIIVIKPRLKVSEPILPIVCITGFALMSLGTMSIFRGKLPIEMAYSSRYLVYSHILIAMLFLFLFLKKRNYIIFIASILFLSLSYISNYQNGLGGFISFYTTLKNSDYAYPLDGKEHAKQIADEACRQNIYCLDKHRND